MNSYNLYDLYIHSRSPFPITFYEVERGLNKLLNYNLEEEEMEEKKVYSVIGKVEIGTDEYRDLIEQRMEVERDKDNYMRENWKKDKEINDLKKQIEVLQSKVQKCEKFFKNNHDASGDIISVFMSIFGEE